MNERSGRDMMPSTSNSGIATKSHVEVDPYSGPYKATRLWNDVISAFRENLPCGRHRRLMRSFENCFSGSSATDWLLEYLKSSRNFGSDVKREKAVSLLNKLYNAGIFEEVKVSKTMSHKTVVQDNRLYRMLPVSPSKLKVTRLPLAPRNDAYLGQTTHSSVLNKDNETKKHKSEIHHPPVKMATRKILSRTNVTKGLEEQSQKYPACRIVPKVLSSSEITDVWKRTFIFRLKKALGITRITDVLSEDLIDGSYIMHNCVYLNKNGTVTNISPDDHLPHWVLSAMKCLAKWPEHHEEGLPNYPGFERDVFGVVKDYFLGLEEPLIPFQLYDAITNVFVTASSRSSNQSDDVFTSKDRESIIKRLWTTASLENIILDLSKKYSLLGTTTDGFINESFHDDDFESQDNVQLGCNDTGMFGISANEDSFCKYGQCKTKSRRQQLSRSAHSSGGLLQKKRNSSHMRKYGSAPNLKISKYETAFGPDNRTVTRVFYQNGVCTDYRHCDEEEEEHNSYSPIETHFSASTEDLVHHDHPVNFERVGSLEFIHLNEVENRNSCPVSKLQRKLQKSKSFATRPRSDSVGDGYGYFPLRKSSNNFHALQHENGGFCGLSQSVEAEPEYLWDSQESLCTHDRLQPVPEYANVSRQSVNNSFSTRCVDQGPTFYQNNSPHQTSTHPQSQYMSHASLRDNQYSTKHVDTPPPFHSMTSLHNYLDSSQNDSSSYGPGYRPVLDASKERSSSTTNLCSHSHNPLQTKSFSAVDRNSHQMTSTPLPPLHASKENSFGRLRSGASLSSLTPFYGHVGNERYNSRSNSFMCYPQTGLSEERVKNCLQLFTLLIAPGNRRKLHMLFKMMVKMTANPNLCLDYTQTTRSLVLETFYRSIIRTKEESDMDEMLVLQLLSFMLDFYGDILTPPKDIKAQVSERLKQMQRPQISYSPGQPTPLLYCQKISVSDFENEKNTVSRQAMEELLESIIRDTKMQVKEKHKRLKQFQVTYPTIYRKRFPTHESEAEVLHAATKSKPKLKPPLVVRPMNRLKGLRL